MKYVDGFVIPVPRKNVSAYRRMSLRASKVWMDHGALEYRECVADDLNTKMGLPFSETVKAKRNETVIFAWIVYKSRGHRDAVNAKVMKDPRLVAMMKKGAMPFDVNRMAYGGFKVIVDA